MCANPLALANNSRANTLDNLDLNRIFPGNETGTLSHRIAKALLDIVKDSDLVIDLHCFDILTPLMAILVKGQDKRLSEKSLEAIRQFSPKQCWVIDSKTKNDSKFAKSFGASLNDLGITNFAVELNNPEVVTGNEINECSNGILRVLSNIGMTEPINPKNKKFNLFERSAITAIEEGIFVPKVKLFQRIKKNQVIGIIRKLPTFDEISIVSNKNGIAMQLSRKKFIFLGQEVAAIGQLNSESGRKKNGTFD